MVEYPPAVSREDAPVLALVGSSPLLSRGIDRLGSGLLAGVARLRSPLSFQRLVESWPSIKEKARVEDGLVGSLLDSASPVGVRGHQILLAAAFEEQRDQLNEKETNR